jgi:hypothetical protein
MAVPVPLEVFHIIVFSIGEISRYRSLTGSKSEMACSRQLLTIRTTWDILPAVGVPASIGLPKPALAEMVSQITFLLKEFAEVNPGRPQSSY